MRLVISAPVKNLGLNELQAGDAPKTFCMVTPSTALIGTGVSALASTSARISRSQSRFRTPEQILDGNRQL